MRPTSTHQQREAVRMLAMAVGVREAARQCGIEQDRVRKWSERYHWLAKPKPENTLSRIVTNGANNLRNRLETDSKTSKTHLSRATVKASRSLSKLPGEEIIERSSRLVDVTNAASKLYGWDSSTGSNAVNLNVLSGGRAVVQVAQNERTGDS